MRVQVNPERLQADPKFSVEHPDSHRPFPSPDPFDLSDADVKNPRVRRLLAAQGLPGGVPGGVFGDLVVVSGEASIPLAAKE